MGGRLRAGGLPAGWSRTTRTTNVFAFARLSTHGARQLVCVCNLSPVPRYGYRVGMPAPGEWREVLNTDSGHYGGGGVGNLGAVEAEAVPWHDQPYSAEVTLPPLGVVWLAAGDPGQAASSNPASEAAGEPSATKSA